jgi:hypothetical protein
VMVLLMPCVLTVLVMLVGEVFIYNYCSSKSSSSSVWISSSSNVSSKSVAAVIAAVVVLAVRQ